MIFLDFNKNIPIRKSWGQNFLIDNNIINKIITNIKPNSKDYIIEVGPGQGSLTIPLSKIVSNIHAIEIDPLLVKHLKNKNIKSAIIYNSDILNWEPQDTSIKYKIVGNLPYNISSPIIFKFLNQHYWDEMIIMVQKELADRIIAKPNCKDYSRISVISQTFCIVNSLFNISNNVFYPKPEIQSSLIKFKRIKKDINITEFSLFIKSAFKQRRKKLKNNLTNLHLTPSLNKYAEKRPENISINEYLEIFNNYIF